MKRKIKNIKEYKNPFLYLQDDYTDVLDTLLTEDEMKEKGYISVSYETKNGWYAYIYKKKPRQSSFTDYDEYLKEVKYSIENYQHSRVISYCNNDFIKK